MSDNGILHVSPFALSEYEKCGERYRLRYVEHVTPPTGPAPSAVRGRALHAGAEHDLRAVVAATAAGAPRAGADLPLAAVQSAASDAFDRAVRGEDSYVHVDGTVEQKQGPPAAFALHDEDPGRAKDLTVAGLVPAWYSKIAPSKNPAAVETSGEVPFDLDDGVRVVLRGRLDDLPADGVVADLKHSRKAWGKTRYSTPADATEDRQLTAYDLMYRTVTGRVPASLGFDTVQLDGPRNGDPTVSGVAHPRVPPRSDAQIGAYLDRTAAVVKGIRAGVFVPADRAEHWWCSAKWCGYWNVCRFGGK